MYEGADMNLTPIKKLVKKGNTVGVTPKGSGMALVGFISTDELTAAIAKVESQEVTDAEVNRMDNAYWKSWNRDYDRNHLRALRAALEAARRTT
jgi:adenosine deaminase